jgi:hypothetical protein
MAGTSGLGARSLPCCKRLCTGLRQLRAHQRIRRPQQGIETVLSSPQTTARLLLQTRCCAQVTTPPIQAEQRLSRVDLQRSGHGSEATRWCLAHAAPDDARSTEPTHKPSSTAHTLLCMAALPKRKWDHIGLGASPPATLTKCVRGWIRSKGSFCSNVRWAKLPLSLCGSRSSAG